MNNCHWTQSGAPIILWLLGEPSFPDLTQQNLTKPEWIWTLIFQIGTNEKLLIYLTLKEVQQHVSSSIHSKSTNFQILWFSMSITFTLSWLGYQHTAAAVYQFVIFNKATYNIIIVS